MKKLKLIDLFSGGGMFSYAAEKLVCGFETIQFCENDPYCQKVLRKHWPTVPIHDDLRTYTPEPHSATGVVGGLPCQDLSVSGKRLGITKETRSGLFYELMRIVCLVRPKYVIMENVAAILNNGMGIVLGELSKARFDAEWSTFRASDYVNACHHRDRWWLLAINRDFTHSTCISKGQEIEICSRGDTAFRSFVTNSDNNGSFTTEKSRSFEKTNERATQGKDKTRQSERSGQPTDSGAFQFNASNTKSIFRNENETIGKLSQFETQEIPRDRNSGQNTPLWPDTKHRLNPNWREYGVEPAICRTDDGIAAGLFTNRTERLKLLGNGLIPQCAAIPLQRVLDLEKEIK